MVTCQNKFRQPFVYYLDLLYELVRRDLKVQYEGTLLGFAWTLILPFLHLGIFYFLFKIILNTESPRFTSFAFIGIVSYAWFQNALTKAAGSASGNRDLALRPGFPVSLLPFIAVTSSMLHFIFTLPVIILIVLFEGHNIPEAVFIMPLVMAVQFTLCLGLGYLLAVVNIIFRDTTNILDTLLRLFMFMSPVFYDPERVPEQYRRLYELNPLVTILQSYRDIILHGIMPPLYSLSIVFLFSMFILCVGFWIFQKQSYRFLEEL